MPEIPKPRAPVAPASAPDTSVADRAAANTDIEEKRRKQMLGRASTQLTTGTGSGSDAINTARKRLLGS